MGVIRISTVNFILLTGLLLALLIWVAYLYWKRKGSLARIFDDRENQLLLTPGSSEESEQLLRVLENKLQALSWACETQDSKQRDVLVKTLYLQSRVLMEAKQRAREMEHQRELLKITIRAGEQERERIAKCIHDECGIVLTALKMNLNDLREETTLTSQQKQKVAENMARLDRLMLSLREITEELASPSLRLIGYFKSVARVCAELSNAQMSVQTNLPNDIRFEPEVELHLYRITLEILNNIIKHARATSINIMYHQATSRQIKIRYNSRGITTDHARQLRKSPKGFGLNNIEARAQLINARIEYLVHTESSSEIVISI